MIATEHEAERQIAAVAASIVGGGTDVLEGCRAIVQLRGNLSEPAMSDPDLLVLVGVESELDDVPTGPARKQWAPEALAVKDAAKAEYLGRVGDEIVRACLSLAGRWGTSE